MPKIIAYTILHYGVDYLPYALKSIYKHVDHINIFYTPSPSHGHVSGLPLPESREELLAAAYLYNPDKKIQWFDYQGTLQEGPQRDSAVQVCKDQGADIVLVMDYDEIWDGLTLTLALEKVWWSNSARNWLINFTHLWRSFNWCCRDEGWPVRFLDLRHEEGTEYTPREYGDIYHFGYAIRNETMAYKLSIHGHKNEIRPDWFNTKWLNWTPGVTDVHPTNDKDFWTPSKFDITTLPEFMKTHPYYNLERID